MKHWNLHPPVLTLTYVNNDSTEDISYILATKVLVSSCQRNSFGFTQMHLVVGHGCFTTEIPLPI